VAAYVIRSLSVSVVLSLMMVITHKYIGAVLMLILMYMLNLFLRQFNCASIGKQTLIYQGAQYIRENYPKYYSSYFYL